MFYRVTSGIRERQKCYDEQIIDGNGNNYPPKCTNQDVFEMDAARVTPFVSSAGNSPRQHGSFDGTPLRFPSMPASIQKDTGWSITGFDEDPQEPHQAAIIEEETSDDAVFEMDL